MTYDAFISYRRSDRITADGIARFLDAFGLKVFVDRSSRAGTNWEPELRAALASAKVLVVLWSRSAAKSNWVEQEWRNVSAECRVVPLKLDGEELPAELSRLTAVEGLDVGSRLLQRSFELMQQGRLSPSQAQEQLVRELAADGVVLEPKKRDALGIFLGFVSGIAAAVALSHFIDVDSSAANDSLPPSSATTPPPKPGRGSWASLLSAAGVSGAAAFGIGLLVAPNKTVTGTTPCPDVVTSGPSSAPTSAVICPAPPVYSSTSPATSRAPLAPNQPTNCPCSREQCTRAATPAPVDGELPRLKAAFESCTLSNDALKGKLAGVERDLKACRASRPPPPPGSATTPPPVVVTRVPTALSPTLSPSAIAPAPPAPAPTLQ